MGDIRNIEDKLDVAIKLFKSTSMIGRMVFKSYSK